MCQIADLLILLCFLVTERVAGHMSPPDHSFSITWQDVFKPVLTWKPPTSATNCTYLVYHNSNKKRVYRPYWSQYTWMNGGSLAFTVETLCNGTISTQYYSNINPVVAENLACYMTSSTNCRCSWNSTNPTLGLYYQFSSQKDNNLQECPSYSVTEGVRTGCDLQASLSKEILILFNGTVGNETFRNTYKKKLNNVRLPALEWNVIISGNKFNITWTPPDIRRDIIVYRINYTECGQNKQKTFPGENAIFYEMDLIPHCPYRIEMRAEASILQMDWTIAKDFDAQSPGLMVYAVAIVLPLVVALLALLMFQYCRKNKEHMFPKIPKPKDLLSDISNNNNKNSVCNLYMPMGDEESCKITMVVDPQTTKGTADKSVHW